ncbi:MAG: nqo3 1 [Cyanobacteria bacterium RYN_339]|nr:nqo3 1 [Cyanobacteria bacterium RYN_339]
MATFSLNGNQVDAPDGMNLIEAAALNGVTIPHYCYHPGLSVAGNCRMCLCEVEGARGPQIACSQNVKDGMVVRTDTPAVEKMRKGVQEFLLLNHPIDCPICDQAGECRLQDYYMEYGKYENRSDVSKVQKEKAMDIGPMVILDQERCILCTRCVRFTDEISKSHELIVSGRGDMSAIETFPGTLLDNPYSGNVVDVCPVGALTSKDFRFKMRVWFMQSNKSVCTGCSNGCNVFLDHKDGVTYRYRPRENQQVNDYWMCDAGRLSYKALNDGRLEHVMLRGVPTTVGDAMKEASSLFQGSRPEGAVAVVGSPFASVEENFALLQLAKALKTDRAFGWNPTPDGFADDFLIKADKTPNRTGVRWLGFNDDRQALLDYLTSGSAQVLVILGNDLAADPAFAEALKKVGTIIYLGSHVNATAGLATFVFPSASHAEKYGSFMNHQGRIQRFYRAYDAAGNAAEELRLLSHLGGTVDQAFDYTDVEDVWADLRARYSELGDLSWYGIGDEGFQVPSLVREPAAAAT